MEESMLSQSQSVDFSFIALFLKATFTVKVVMLVLIFSSFSLKAKTIKAWVTPVSYTHLTLPTKA